MSQDMLIKMIVPIPVWRIVSVPSMLFNRWLPTLEEDAILIEEGNISLRLWFDLSCWYNMSRVPDPTQEDLTRYSPVLVEQILAYVTLHDVPDEFHEYLAKGQLPSGADPLFPLYRELGKQVYEITLKHVNRLIAYVRSQKGQYWLQEYVVDEGNIRQTNELFSARVLLNGSWKAWMPPFSQVIRVNGGGVHDQDRWIDKDDWQRLNSFVNSARRTTLVWELLAGAEWLAAIGHRRSALTEAVTALEVAVISFSKKPNLDRLAQIVDTERANVSSLGSWIEHIGFSGAVHFFFPIIFGDEQLSKETLRVPNKT